MNIRSVSISFLHYQSAGHPVTGRGGPEPGGSDSGFLLIWKTTKAATMPLKAILFGSIGTLVETSQMQLDAFNEAFRQADLDWHWSKEEYTDLLKKPGGQRRIADYAASKGTPVDDVAIHRIKTELYDARMEKEGLQPRAGVHEVVNWAATEGISLGFVTSTERENVDAILNATSGISAMDFAFTGDRTLAKAEKPAPDIYNVALERLKIKPLEAIAIEDTLACFKAPMAAGIPTIAFPNAFAEREGYDGAIAVVDKLTVAFFSDRVQAMISNRTA